MGMLKEPKDFKVNPNDIVFFAYDLGDPEFTRGLLHIKKILFTKELKENISKKKFFLKYRVLKYVGTTEF